MVQRQLECGHMEIAIVWTERGRKRTSAGNLGAEGVARCPHLGGVGVGGCLGRVYRG